MAAGERQHRPMAAEPIDAVAPPRPPADDATESAAPRHPVATPLDRAWLEQLAVRLDPRRQPSVPGPMAVADILRSAPQPTARSAAPRGVRLAPRSMAAAPLFAGSRNVRIAALLATLSRALDAAERLPDGHATATAYIGLRLGPAAGLSDLECSDLLYAALLKDAGSVGYDPDQDDGPVPAYLSRATRVKAVVRSLGLPSAVGRTIELSLLPWSFGPAGLSDEAIPRPARVLAVAAVAARALQTRPAGDPVRALRSRRGSDLDPLVVDLALGLGRLGLWDEVTAPDLRTRLLDLEPAHLARIGDAAAVDAVTATFADLVDSRTPSLGRHGTRVADQAVRLAERLGLDDHILRDVRRAGLLHDLGKLMVPMSILEKAGPLSPAERSLVDRHAETGAAVLADTPFLEPVARMIAAHHEPLDGNRKRHGANDADGALLAPVLAARVLAIADRFVGLCSERPYRKALPPDQAVLVLEGAVTEPVGRRVLEALRAELPDREPHDIEAEDAAREDAAREDAARVAAGPVEARPSD
jgi:putative nucleotidyltransferase with HDIG domain